LFLEQAPANTGLQKLLPLQGGRVIFTELVIYQPQRPFAFRPGNVAGAMCLHPSHEVPAGPLVEITTPCNALDNPPDTSSRRQWPGQGPIVSPTTVPQEESRFSCHRQARLRPKVRCVCHFPPQRTGCHPGTKQTLICPTPGQPTTHSSAL